MTKSQKNKETKSRKGYHPGYSPQHCVDSGSVPRSSALPRRIISVQEPPPKKTSPLLILLLVLVVVVGVLVFLGANDVVDFKGFGRFFKKLF